jgi:hypothetical protein
MSSSPSTSNDDQFLISDSLPASERNEIDRSCRIVNHRLFVYRAFSTTESGGGVTHGTELPSGHDPRGRACAWLAARAHRHIDRREAFWDLPLVRSRPSGQFGGGLAALQGVLM